MHFCSSSIKTSHGARFLVLALMLVSCVTFADSNHGNDPQTNRNYNGRDVVHGNEHGHDHRPDGHGNDRDHHRDRDRGCRRNIRITAYDDLRFGSFAVSGPGSITVDPNGIPTPNGGIYFMDANTSNALLKVEGCPGQKYQIALPEHTRLRGRRGSKMRLDSFTSQPADVGELNPYGEQHLRVGGTLHANPNQREGRYRGQFRVEISIIYE